MRPPSMRHARLVPAVVSAPAWDAFVDQHRYGHFLQTSRWGTHKSQHGWRKALSAVVAPDLKTVGGGMLLLRDLPGRLGSLAYMPRGPVVDWDDEPVSQVVIAHAREIAQRHGAIALLVEPSLPDTPTDQHMLGGLGFQACDFSIQPRRTLRVNLDVDEEVDILAAMKQKTRYNVGLARRRGVTVRAGGPEDLQRFYDLYQTTSTRKDFGIHPIEYYRTFLQEFAWGARPMGALLLAEHADHPGRALAGIIVTAVGGTGTYVYGASANEQRELMPTYALQWEGMRWARARGCHTYDLWGVPDEDEDVLEAGFESRQDGLWGVYRTKRGYGGQLVRLVGLWAAVFAPMRWRLFNLARRWRNTQLG